jgi:hypothetical protein
MYSVPSGIKYRTKSGSEAGKTSPHTLLDIGNTTITKGGVVFNIITWCNYPNLVGMYIDRRLLTLEQEPPASEGAVIVLTEPDGTKRYFNEQLNA